MKRLLSAAIGVVLGGQALAADLPEYAPPPQMLAPLPIAYNWSGFYLGVETGWFWNEIDTSDPVLLVQPESDSLIFGGYAGAAWQWKKLVLGVEGDLDWLDAEATERCSNTRVDCTAALDWQASLRGNLGVAFKRLLIYATGGVSWAGFEGDLDSRINTTSFSDEATLFGWTAGAGVAVAISRRFIVKAEYRYTDYNEEDMFYDIAYPGVDVDTHSVRIGGAIKFGGAI